MADVDVAVVEEESSVVVDASVVVFEGGVGEVGVALAVRYDPLSWVAEEGVVEDGVVALGDVDGVAVGSVGGDVVVGEGVVVGSVFEYDAVVFSCGSTLGGDGVSGDGVGAGLGE